MFIVIWRGYGLVALAAAILPLAACVGLIDVSTGLGLLGGGLGMLAAGLICFGANRALVRAAARRAEEATGRDPDNELRVGGTVDQETTHTLYFIPLWVWGWFYSLLGLFFTVGGIAGVIGKGWKN
jgi:hypothetical protein